MRPARERLAPVPLPLPYFRCWRLPSRTIRTITIGTTTKKTTPGWFMSGLVAVDGGRRERGQAHGDVLRPLGAGGGVADPFPFPREHPLSGGHVEDALLVLDPQRAAEHDRVFVEVGALARLDPARRALHVGHADVVAAGVHPAGVFEDQL